MREQLFKIQSEVRELCSAMDQQAMEINAYGGHGAWDEAIPALQQALLELIDEEPEEEMLPTAVEPPQPPTQHQQHQKPAATAATAASGSGSSSSSNSSSHSLPQQGQQGSSVRETKRIKQGKELRELLKVLLLVNTLVRLGDIQFEKVVKSGSGKKMVAKHMLADNQHNRIENCTNI